MLSASLFEHAGCATSRERICEVWRYLRREGEGGGREGGRKGEKKKIKKRRVEQGQEKKCRQGGMEWP